jgi:hypothetical protein
MEAHERRDILENFHAQKRLLTTFYNIYIWFFYIIKFFSVFR